MQLYDLHLWEFYACCRAYKKRCEAEQQEQVALAWSTANFASAAIAGKLKPLSTYLSSAQSSVSAPSITQEEMDALDKRLAERRMSREP